MERRWSQRKGFESEVILSCSGMLMRGQTKNISYSGAFVDTGMATLPPDTRVLLSFNDHLSERTETVQISAQVVHGNGEGVGLLFDDYADPARRFLENIILS